MRSIRQLSPKTQASLQASLVAVTLDDICAILLRHALAAFTSHTRKPLVTISMDYETWTLTVKHNGSATDADLDMLSYVGILHSRTCSGVSDTTRIVQQGSVVYSGTSPETNLHDGLSGPMRMLEDGRGAITCLRDIFHSLPVRRSFLSADLQKKKQNETLMEMVKKLSLLKPTVNFRLMAASGTREPKTLLTLAPATDVVERFRQAYGREAIERSSAKSFETELVLRSAGIKNKTRSRAVSLRLYGLISLPVVAKAPQVLLINGYNWAELESSRRSQMSAFDNEHIVPYLDLLGITSSGNRGGQPQIDLFTLIDNRVSRIPNANASTKGLQHAFAIIATLENVSDMTNQKSSTEATSFKAALLDSIYDADSSNRQNAGDEHANSSSTSSVASVEYVGAKRPRTAPSAPATDSSLLPRRPKTASLGNSRHACHDVQPPPGMTTWRESQTNRLFFIDTKTGQSFGPIDRGADGSDFAQRKDNKGIVDRSKLRKRRIDDDGQHAPDWLSATLKDWKNPAFGQNGAAMLATMPSDVDEFDDPELDTALAALPSTPRRSKRLAPAPHRSSRFFGERETSTADGDLEAHSTNDQVEKTAIDVAAELPISRADLATAHVLNQVDEKFVLCIVTPERNGSPVLVCFDQHAVDERYRLEQLLQNYVTTCHGSAPADASNDAPITVSINRKEYDLLSDDRASSTATAVQASLTFLGFDVVGVVLVHEGLGHAQVDLASIPDILRDRVVSLTGRVHNPDLMSGVFRAVVAELVTHPIPPSVLTRDSLDVEPSSWLTTTRHIPPSLMDLFCSKACRSAIMFNDPLSKAACQALIDRLALCQFPFQCAHGRPTLVPLCRL